MSLAIRLATPLLALAPLLVPAHGHADSTADEAEAVQAAIGAWVAGLAGPNLDLGDHNVQVTPAGAAYRFELPVAGPMPRTGWLLKGDPLTATARRLDDGSWAIDAMHLPTPLRADYKTPLYGMPRSWILQLAGQDITGTFDPSLTAPSAFDATVRGYNLTTRTGDRTQTSHLDHYTWHGGWQQAGDGRLSVSGSGAGENLSVVTDSADGGRVSVTVGRIRTSGQFDRVSFDRLGEAVRSLTSLLPAAMRAGGPAHHTNADDGTADDAVADDAIAKDRATAASDRAGLRRLVLALRDLLGGGQQETSLERVRIDIGGQGGTLAGFTLGGRASGSDGMVDLSVRLDMEGIDTPLFPAGPLHDYLPRRIALTPHVSGIPAAELVALLLRALDEGNQDTLQADALDLVSKGPLKAGLDDVVLDLGAAVFKASGTVVIAAADDIEGTARVVATGLDTLIRRANAVPELRGAAPFLAFLKAIGEQNGDTTSWNLAYTDGHTLVNGADLLALAPPGGPAPDRPHGHRP